MSKEMVQIPDGNGGMIETEAEKFSDGASADAEKQQSRLDEEAAKAKETRIGAAAEAFNKYHKGYATDHRLSEDELVAAMHLELLNWREFWPKELGGVERFDEICDETYTWFEENK